MPHRAVGKVKNKQTNNKNPCLYPKRVKEIIEEFWTERLRDDRSRLLLGEKYIASM